MPHWWTLCIEAYPLRRLLLPSPSQLPLTFLRRSSPPLQLRLSFPRCRGSLATLGASSTCRFAGPLPRPPLLSRCFVSSSSPTYSYTPSAAMQSVRISSNGDIADALMEALLCFGAATCSIEDSNLGAPQEQEGHVDGVFAADIFGRTSSLAIRQAPAMERGKQSFCGCVFLSPRVPTSKDSSMIGLQLLTIFVNSVHTHHWELVNPVGRGGLLSLHSMMEVMLSCFLGAPCKSSITALFAAGDDVGEAIAMAANSVGLKEMPLYEVKELEDCDWVLEVESQFKPIEVSRGLWIVPKWSQPPDAKALNVIIDPGLAFGTGEHPTTRLCLQWLHRVVGPGDRILDYGTGSGILSIAALKMGATYAIGVDIDPAAISSAEYNASLNNLKSNTLQVYVASADGKDPVPKDFTGFDVVIANILLNPLVELAGRITGYCKPGGLVGVSGILVEQVAQVKEAYSQYLEGITTTYDNGWACVSGRKKRFIQAPAETNQSVEHHS